MYLCSQFNYLSINFTKQGYYAYVDIVVHVAGFAPGPVNAIDGSDGGADLQWNNGLEPKRKRLKEQDFLENNSQISSVDFLQARTVSTGLGLSLDNTRLASSADSALMLFIGDDIDNELHRQEAEIDRFLKAQVKILVLISFHVCMKQLPWSLILF